MQSTSLKALRQLSESDKDFSFDMISHVTSNLDLTETQLNKLKTAYRAIGLFLANKGGWLENCHIYAQGSVGIGTSVKPLNEKADMDIDLVLHLPEENYPTTVFQANDMLNHLIQELQSSTRYQDKIEREPKRRCVTMQYGGIEGQSFHMDITPSMPEKMYVPSHKDEVRVPDIKTANSPSHPYGYRAWFRKVCSQNIRWSRQSRYRAQKDAYAGSVEELPGQTRKTVLQIVVQLLKRHRDIWKHQPNNHYREYAPISIIITTLAGRAYDKCSASGKEYSNPFDLMLDVLEEMPNFVGKHRLADGSISYTIPNPALPSENFSDKWHEKPFLATAFSEWYGQAISDISLLLEFDQGIDVACERSSTLFGKQVAKGLAEKLANTLNKRRVLNQATVSAIGLGLSKSVSAKPVPNHNFFGDFDEF